MTGGWIKWQLWGPLSRFSQSEVPLSTRKLALIFCSDITDRSAVRSLVENIRGTLPPIAGVANGAMVLQDTSIVDMTVEIMNKVTRPKVDGSRYLDELFPDNTLDFFVLFSSLATVFGNHGQSNYTTANMFLNGLAGQRRKRGLAGSVIAIGAIMGVGYMSREVSQTALNRIKNLGYTMMSERDFHQLFAEAVLASTGGSDTNPEIMSGISVARHGEARPVTWSTNPMFSHCIVRSGALSVSLDDTNASVPIRRQLLEVTSQDEAYEVLKGRSSGCLSNSFR